MSGTVQSFVNRFGPAANAVAAQTGLSPDFVLGVAGEESGWGQHYIGNNLFGIGGSNSVSYATPDDSFAAFGSLIANNPKYAAVLNAGGDPQAEALALGTTPYNPSGLAYGAKVAQTTQMVSNDTGGIPGNPVPGATGTPGTGGSTTTPSTTTPAASSSTAASGSWWGELATRVGLVTIGLAMTLGGVYLMGRRVSL
jgi:hypothetical protein